MIATFPAASRCLSRPIAKRLALMSGWLVALAIGLIAGAVQAAALDITLRDAASGAPLAAQRVHVYDKSPAGTLSWKRGGTTDGDGRVRLEVTAPANGDTLVARARPYAMWIERPVPLGGSVTIRAGVVRAQVVNGVTGKPLVGAPVVLGTREVDGRFVGLTTVTTDTAGALHLDPPALGSEIYFLRADSPIDGSRKYSDPITVAGSVVFRVGNPAVTVNLTDWTTAAPLAAQRVEVRERLPDGTLAWTTTRETDGNGRVKLDLDGLETGRRYVVRVKPYLQTIERDIAAPGWVSIRAGRVPGTIRNGDTGAPLANAEVTLFTRTAATAPWQYEFRSTTGADGRLVFDPVHLGTREYALRAASPVDGSLKYSTVFKAAGPLTFAVGNRGLTVRVVTASDAAPLATLAVSANEIRADGSLGPTITRTTDADGSARFDLDGLGHGKRYRLRTRPFLLTITRDIDTTGWLDIAAGALRVRVEHGATGVALAAREVKLHALRADGTRQGLRTLVTARDGSLVLDPPELGSMRYQLSAVSPFDGSTKFSQIFTAGGDAVFSVGSTGLTVRVQDFKSGLALAGQSVSVYERQSDDTLAWVANRTTDGAGQARFDLEEVGTRRYVARVKPYLQWIARDITTNGLLEIRAGNLRVGVKRGDDGRAYPNAAVKLLAVRGDGEYEGVAGFTTPANGELVFDLPDLGPTQYVLRAPSPVDGSLKYSPVITSAGQTGFTVGNKPLGVQLIDFQSRAALGATAIQIYELDAEDRRTWVTQRATAADGTAVFDLDGLGKGRRYMLRTRPFAQWLEHTAKTTGDVVIEGGRATVQLIDADAQRPLAGSDVQARTKAADGALSGAIGHGTTDANGRLRFDPPGLGTGGVAVYVAVNPFGTGVHHYSAPSIATGPIRFEISRAGPRKLDRTPAELGVTMPRVGQRVSLNGMTLSGHVADAGELREVTVEVFAGTTRLGRYVATIDHDTQHWHLHAPAFDVAADTRLTVRVVATDLDYNATTRQFAVTAIADTTPPTLAFRTPGAGAVTHGQGLLVVGNVRDDTQWRGVEVQVEEGSTVLTPWRKVDIDPVSGDWAYAMPVEAFTDRSTLTLRARGTDTSANASETTRTIGIDPNGDPFRHLLARITYGETPGLWEDARRTGYTEFLDQQLAPASIDDSALETRLAALPVTGTNALRRDMLLRAVASRRQLNEVMTGLWDNHFNTDIQKHGHVEHELADNAAFRRHALGRFRDLLGISARSVAMLVYLDNAHSHKRWPNENYARELLELHTMSTGYTQHDIDEIARAFTGWTVRDNAFTYMAARHDDGAKRVLGDSLPAGGGERDGERILDLLAGRSETARHLCGKLALRFVSETPSAALLTRCVNVFLAQRDAPNQMAQVLRSLLTSAEFRAAANRGSQVKDSIRFAIGAIRATAALRSGNDLAAIVEQLGQPLLSHPAPDGYPLDSASWISPHLQRTRLEFVGRLIENFPRGTAVRAEPRALLHGWPTVTTPEGVAARVLQNLNAGVFDASELALALAVLTDDGTRTFTLDAPHADAALARLTRTALSLPRHQMQ